MSGNKRQPQQHKPAADSGRTETTAAADRKPHGHKPVWNSNISNNRQHKKAPVGRDPAYERRREQRLERQRELLAQAAANERLVPQRFTSRDRQRQNSETDDGEPTLTERGRQRRHSSVEQGQSQGLHSAPALNSRPALKSP